MLSRFSFDIINIMVDAKTARNLTFKDLAMMGLLAFGTACSLADEESQRRIDANKTPLATTAPRATVSPRAASSPTILQAYRLNEFQYQPGGRRPLSTERVIIGGSNVEILNYSDFAFNSETIRDYLNFLLQLPQQLPQITINVSGRDLGFNLGLKPNIARRIYFTRPSDAMPSWWANVPPNITGITRTLSRNDGLEEAITLVKLFRSTATKQDNQVAFANINQENEWAVMTEICQSTLQVTGQKEEDNRDAKEILCNTIGAAAILRSEGGDYASFIFLVRTLPGESEMLPRPITLTNRLPQSQYLRIPPGKVIR